MRNQAVDGYFEGSRLYISGWKVADSLKKRAELALSLDGIRDQNQYLKKSWKKNTSNVTTLTAIDRHILISLAMTFYK